MTNFLRRLKNKEAWADLLDSPLWDNGDCPPALLSHIFDNRDGVSVFRIGPEVDILTVAVAVEFQRTKIGDFAYTLIPESILKHFDIKQKTTSGETFDKEVNKLHVDLYNITGKALIGLAKSLRDSAEFHVIARRDIVKAAAERFNDGRMNRSELAKKNANAIADLWRTGDIHL